MRSTKTLFNPADGDKDGLTEDEGEAEALGDRDLDALLDPEDDGDADFEGDPLGLVEGLLLELGESDVL